MFIYCEAIISTALIKGNRDKSVQPVYKLCINCFYFSFFSQINQVFDKKPERLLVNN
jgi:hypothetical protein